MTSVRFARLRIISVLLVCGAISSSCGTFLSRIPYFAGGLKGVYRGVRYDAGKLPVGIIDMPFSFVMDTLLLPLDLIRAFELSARAGVILGLLEGKRCPGNSYRLRVRPDATPWGDIGVEVYSSVERCWITVENDRDVAILHRWVMGSDHPALPMTEGLVGSATFEEWFQLCLKETGMPRR